MPMSVAMGAEHRAVEIWRAWGRPPERIEGAEVLKSEEVLEGEEVLPGLRLELGEIWED